MGRSEQQPSQHETPRWGRAFAGVIAALCALVCPFGAAQAQPAETLELTPGFSPDPIVRSGVAGGSVAAETLGTGPMGACVGWVGNGPNHEMELTEPFDFFELAVSSEGDTTLVIEGPVGFWCNDDSTGLNPAMFGRWAAGHYRIYVGTYHAGQSPGYTITFSQRRDAMPPVGGEAPGAQGTPPSAAPPVAPAPVGAPPPGLEQTGTAASFGSLAVSPGFVPDPQTLSGIAGGPLRADSLGNSALGPCRGNIAARPSHILTVESILFLRLDVTSAGDTTLIVEGPAGWWCNDDSNGLNPRLAGAFPAGTYRIWVGSYNPGESPTYNLELSSNW